MTVFFVLQVGAFFASIVMLTGWINDFMVRRLRLERVYLPAFSWGWCCYLAIYLVGRWRAASAESARLLSTCLVVAVLLLAGILVVRGRRAPLRAWSWPAAGWARFLVLAFVAGTLYVGPYLEFPSDPVEYLYRVQAWEKVRSLDYDASLYSGRFAPFAYHWLLRSSNIGIGDRMGLSLVTALVQGMLLWSVIRLTTVLTGGAGWGCLGGLLSLGYFGYNAISFYRYVALSGALLSHVAFVEGLTLLVGAVMNERWRYILLWPPLLVLAWTNHEEGTLFLLNSLVGVGVLLLLFRYRMLASRFRRGLLWLTCGLVASAVVLTTLRAQPTWRYPPPPSYVTDLATLLGYPVRVHAFVMLDEMLGVVGWLSAFLALAILATRLPGRRLDIAAALTVWPLLVVWNPVALSFLSRALPGESFHRLLYGSIYWLFPVVLLKYLTDRMSETGATPTNARRLFAGLSVAILLVLLGLSWIPDAPLYGRMRHVWRRVDGRFDGRNLKRLVEYVRTRAPDECVDAQPDPRYLPIRRYVLSDPYVSAYLMATGYFYGAITRWGDVGWESPPLGLTVTSQDGVDYGKFRSILRDRSVCYVVLYRQQAPLVSWLGAMTGHWKPDVVRTEQFYSPRFLEWITGHPEHFQLVFRDRAIAVYRPR